jgi:hypothetical protein
MVRMSCNEYLNLVYRFLCHKLLAESVGTQWSYVIHHVTDVYSGGSEAEISQRSWIQMILHRHCILAANRGCMHFLYNC